ncbi:hypothetical protein RCL_jg9703.t1 [Rhizophagus clarus]|uniref:Uncharacterized protein n=1 Tax=Rhizophagus clarus TaxID=94130 RepID=A0A8H3QWS4_9GLOM|nr:hypothetical protein RCL_jg9703.t1 [Rhizophagus clarus]
MMRYDAQGINTFLEANVKQRNCVSMLSDKIIWKCRACDLHSRNIYSIELVATEMDSKDKNQVGDGGNRCCKTIIIKKVPITHIYRKVLVYPHGPINTTLLQKARKLCGGDDDEKISQSWNRCVLPSIISTTLIIINDCLNFKYSMWLKSPQFVAKMSFMNYLYSKTHPSSFVCH